MIRKSSKGFPEGEVRLVWVGREVELERTFEELCIEADSVIHVVVRCGFPIVVRTPSRCLTLEVSSTDSISTVKVKVGEEIGIAVPLLQLLFSGKELEDEKLVRDYGFEKGVRLDLSIKRTGTRTRIFIGTREGFLIPLQVGARERVKDVKAKVHELRGIDPMTQRLICCGKQLEDEYTLEDYGIRQDFVIYLVLRQISPPVISQMIDCLNVLNEEANPALLEKARALLLAQQVRPLLRDARFPLSEAFANEENKNIIEFLVPNLSAPADVALIQPLTRAKIEATADLLREKAFAFDSAYAAMQVLHQAAVDRGLKFAVGDPEEASKKDSAQRAVDFALANSAITEDSLFLLGSNAPEHEFKAFTVHLNGDFSPLEGNPGAQAEFAREVRPKLARVHECGDGDIVFYFASRGTRGLTYGVNPGTQSGASAAQRTQQAQAVFGTDLNRLEAHPSFRELHLNPYSFDTRWNFDFRRGCGWEQGELRGRKPYSPPVGWYRYGLKVAGKYGSETWLGMSNIPGEWPVAYHGTKVNSVSDILASSLRPGTGNSYGYGVYCAPTTGVPDGYAASCVVAGHPVKFMLMVRVNASGEHECPTTPCPAAGDSRVTLHLIPGQKFWFAGSANQSCQNIRCYGLLVKDA
jgi:hypothetical protein